MTPEPLKETLNTAKRLASLCRLHRPVDIPLFLLPGLWAAVLAAEGVPKFTPLLLLLLAALLIRCAAWTFNDLMEPRLLPHAPESFVGEKIVSPIEAQRLFAVLLTVAMLLILPLGLPLFYFTLPALAGLLAIPFVRSRLLFTQPFLGLCYAWLVPMAWLSQDASLGKATWLVFTAVLLWASAFTTLYAIPRCNHEARTGVRSLAQLFGDLSWLFILAMQLGAIFALWLVGQQLSLGIFFSLGLITALLLLPYQQWLLLHHPSGGAMSSYRAQTATAVAILCGISFHYLCLAQ